MLTWFMVSDVAIAEELARPVDEVEVMVVPLRPAPEAEDEFPELKVVVTTRAARPSAAAVALEVDGP